jgi:hypothetical protein
MNALMRLMHATTFATQNPCLHCFKALLNTPMPKASINIYMQALPQGCYNSLKAARIPRSPSFLSYLDCKRVPCINFSGSNYQRTAGWERRAYTAKCGAQELDRLHPDVDDHLSRRALNLDAAGYFIIRVDYDAAEIIAEHYTNAINKDGE